MEESSDIAVFMEGKNFLGSFGSGKYWMVHIYVDNRENGCQVVLSAVCLLYTSSLGMMTINALVASDAVLIPVQAAYLPVKGLQQLIKTISMVKKRLNRKLQIMGILLTMVDFRRCV